LRSPPGRPADPSGPLFCGQFSNPTEVGLNLADILKVTEDCPNGVIEAPIDLPVPIVIADSVANALYPLDYILDEPLRLHRPSPGGDELMSCNKHNAQ